MPILERLVGLDGGERYRMLQPLDELHIHDHALLVFGVRLRVGRDLHDAHYSLRVAGVIEEDFVPLLRGSEVNPGGGIGDAVPGSGPVFFELVETVTGRFLLIEPEGHAGLRLDTWVRVEWVGVTPAVLLGVCTVRGPGPRQFHFRRSSPIRSRTIVTTVGSNPDFELEPNSVLRRSATWASIQRVSLPRARVPISRTVAGSFTALLWPVEANTAGTPIF